MDHSDGSGRPVERTCRGSGAVDAGSPRRRGRGRVARTSVLLLAAASAACASAGGAAGPGASSALPPIPRVAGSVQLKVVYPDSLSRIAVRDSNFIFGSTGTGDAQLTIDGSPVPVEPNGAYLAWLPVPEPVSGDTAVYRLVARRGGTADTLEWPVLLPPERFRGTGPAWIDTASVTGVPERWALPDEDLDLSVRGAPGATAWLVAGALRYRMTETAAGAYEVRIPAGELYTDGRGAGDGRADTMVSAEGRADTALSGVARSASTDTSSTPPALTEAVRGQPLDSIDFAVELAAAGDTARVTGRYPLRVLDGSSPPVAELREVPDPGEGPRRVIVGRPLLSGPYLWRFPERTVVAIDGRVGNRYRVRLGPDLEAWVDTAEARFLPAGTPPPDARVGNVHIDHGPQGLSIRLRLGDRVPLRVRADGRRLRLTLYDARGATDRLGYGASDPMLRSASWDQLPGRRWELVLTLARPVWGWRVTWEGGDDVPEAPREAAAGWSGPFDGGGTLRLEVRRPPRIDPRHPLRGRIVAVDPGHPPVGAHGPTGLYEADANLAVARHLAVLLRQAGARPVLVRHDTLPVGLYERVLRAEAAGAELFVSIHNNALPDGVDPFGHSGSSTYYYHENSAALAKDLEAGLLRTEGLRDLGVSWADLAVCRQTWMPAALAEGAFMMIPRQEAALRTPAFQEAYAKGVLEGLRTFLRSRAEGADDSSRREER